MFSKIMFVLLYVSDTVAQIALFVRQFAPIGKSRQKAKSHENFKEKQSNKVYFYKELHNH